VSIEFASPCELREVESGCSGMTDVVVVRKLSES
jgi:hypothetical protein